MYFATIVFEVQLDIYSKHWIQAARSCSNVSTPSHVNFARNLKFLNSNHLATQQQTFLSLRHFLIRRSPCIFSNVWNSYCNLSSTAYIAHGITIYTNRSECIVHTHALFEIKLEFQRLSTPCSHCLIYCVISPVWPFCTASFTSVISLQKCRA